VNGETAVKKRFVSPGDVVSVVIAPELEITTLTPENIPFPIAYEDEHLVVVDKPKGMITHPGNGVHSGTLANALAFRYPNLSDVNGPMRPGILHRLDKDTSGLLVVAKNNAAHANLAKQLETREMHRIYHALVWRELSEPSGSVDQPIARNPRDPLKMGVHSGGKRALTHYKVLGFYQFATYLELTLDTGRTHQIRVHMAFINHPVVGDPTYGGRQTLLGRIQPIHQPFAIRLLSFFETQALHAHRLSFLHPVTGKRLEFESPLPKEMVDALAFMEQFKQDG
jgi:23S rRNA pseudouridine1911/1915/1917 synthase